MTTEDTYKTRDIGEAGALLLQQQVLLTVERQGSLCWFIFKNQKVCEEISSKFFFGVLTVNAREYKETLDRLKNRIFART
jgi:hypothetical protein